MYRCPSVLSNMFHCRWTALTTTPITLVVKILAGQLDNTSHLMVYLSMPNTRQLSMSRMHACTHAQEHIHYTYARMHTTHMHARTRTYTLHLCTHAHYTHARTLHTCTHTTHMHAHYTHARTLHTCTHTTHIPNNITLWP